MSKSNLNETAYLKLIYQNIPFANIGDVGGLQPSVNSGNLYIALYTTDPTDTDVGLEATYTGYARVNVVRSVVGWTVSGNSCTNAVLVSFPTSTGGTSTVTHFGVRTALTGGDLLHFGALGAALTVATGNTPKFDIGNLTITEN